MDGAIAGGLVGALRVCGRVVDGWTGDMCGCVGEMGGAVVAGGRLRHDTRPLLNENRQRQERERQ